VGLFGSQKKMPERAPLDSLLALVVLFGPERLKPLLAEDVAIYEESGFRTVSYEPPTLTDLTARIASQKPTIVHLLATFDGQGSLHDPTGAEVALYELMEVAENSGVGVFIVGSQNRSRDLVDYIHHVQHMSFMAITKRNRHYPTFMRGLLGGLAYDPRFAVAFNELAMQGPGHLQEGKPLPGAFAICPRKKGGELFLRSLAQP
jgi:hypothetical protein